MKYRDFVRFAVNGELHEVRGADCFLMLADYLRKRKGLTGTKVVCAEGDCGACTVLKAFALKGKEHRFLAINSCIALVGQLDGAHLVTVEGLAEGQALNAIQEAMVQQHGSQCGYCTPGIVVALSGMLNHCQVAPEERQIKNCLTGNLCRCTGYTPILEAALSLPPKPLVSLEERYVTKALSKALRETQSQPFHITAGEAVLWGPTDLAEVSKIRKKQPEARLLSAATDLGVQINKGVAKQQQWISLHLIPELYRSSRRGNRLSFGARVSFEEIRVASEELVPEFSHLIDVFASPQIKHTATLVGNIANASPIGDSLPFLLVADGRVKVQGLRGERDIPLTELFVGYRKLALKPSEWISEVSFRSQRAGESLRLYKAATRKDMDISAVSAAFLFDIERSTLTVKEARIAYGGVAAVPLRMLDTEAFLKDRVLSSATLEAALVHLQEEIQPLSDVRGSAAYRRLLVQNFFRMFVEELWTQRGGRDDSHPA